MAAWEVICEKASKDHHVGTGCAKLRLRIQSTGTRIGGCAIEYNLEPNLVATRASRSVHVKAGIDIKNGVLHTTATRFDWTRHGIRNNEI
jgi:hypothetical protein